MAVYYLRFYSWANITLSKSVFELLIPVIFKHGDDIFSTVLLNYGYGKVVYIYILSIVLEYTSTVMSLMS